MKSCQTTTRFWQRCGKDGACLWQADLSTTRSPISPAPVLFRTTISATGCSPTTSVSASERLDSCQAEDGRTSVTWQCTSLPFWTAGFLSTVKNDSKVVLEKANMPCCACACPMLASISVSYTHLTLPTIYSV